MFLLAPLLLAARPGGPPAQDHFCRGTIVCRARSPDRRVRIHVLLWLRRTFQDSWLEVVTRSEHAWLDCATELPADGSPVLDVSYMQLGDFWESPRGASSAGGVVSCASLPHMARHKNWVWRDSAEERAATSSLDDAIAVVPPTAAVLLCIEFPDFGKNRLPLIEDFFAVRRSRAQTCTNGPPHWAQCAKPASATCPMGRPPRAPPTRTDPTPCSGAASRAMEARLKSGACQGHPHFILALIIKGTCVSGQITLLRKALKSFQYSYRQLGSDQGPPSAEWKGFSTHTNCGSTMHKRFCVGQ